MSTPKFLFDECIGKPILLRLQNIVTGAEFAHVCDMFEQGELDRDWIPKLANEPGWVVLTSDGGKRTRRGGKLPQLCAENGVTHILLAASIHNKISEDKLAALVLMWPNILATHDAKPGSRFVLRYRDRVDKKGLALVLDEVDLPIPRGRKKK